MRAINADDRVTVETFNLEEEEYENTEMSVSDALDYVTNEGCPKIVDATEMTEEERRDLENLRRVKRGESMKIVCRDYVIYNGEWYRKHKWDWPVGEVPKARLMTLEEYRARAEMPLDERDPVWEEWTKLAKRDGWMMPNPGYEGYGTLWRCWTSRPTEAQRAAEGWPAIPEA